MSENDYYVTAIYERTLITIQSAFCGKNPMGFCMYSKKVFDKQIRMPEYFWLQKPSQEEVDKIIAKEEKFVPAMKWEETITFDELDVIGVKTMFAVLGVDAKDDLIAVFIGRRDAHKISGMTHAEASFRSLSECLK